MEEQHSSVASIHIRLPDFLNRDAICLDLRARTREEAVAELCGQLESAGLVLDPAAAVRAVLEREATSPTGIGEGVAVPHGRVHGSELLAVALGISRGGIDFGADDHVPVHILMLLLAPDHMPAAHLKLLAQIAHLLRQPMFRGKLLACENPEEVLALVRESFDAILHH